MVGVKVLVQPSGRTTMVLTKRMDPALLMTRNHFCCCLLAAPQINPLHEIAAAAGGGWGGVGWVGGCCFNLAARKECSGRTLKSNAFSRI